MKTGTQKFTFQLTNGGAAVTGATSADWTIVGDSNGSTISSYLGVTENGLGYYSLDVGIPNVGPYFVGAAHISGSVSPSLAAGETVAYDNSDIYAQLVQLQTSNEITSFQSYKAYTTPFVKQGSDFTFVTTTSYNVTGAITCNLFTLSALVSATSQVAVAYPTVTSNSVSGSIISVLIPASATQLFTRANQSVTNAYGDLKTSIAGQSITVAELTIPIKRRFN